MMEEEHSLQSTEDLRSTLNAMENSITRDFISEENTQNLKDLTAVFNAIQTKKAALRIQKLGNLFDTVTDQMEERFTKRSGEFSNRDLLDYMTAVQTALEKAQKNVSTVDELPAITLNQQNNQQVNINVNDVPLDRESRARVLEAISSIVKTNATDINTLMEDLKDAQNHDDGDTNDTTGK